MQYPHQPCFYTRGPWGHPQLVCNHRPYFLTPYMCSQLFLNNQNVPPPCCRNWGVGCTPGANAPISYRGMRRFY